MSNKLTVEQAKAEVLERYPDARVVWAKNKRGAQMASVFSSEAFERLTSRWMALERDAWQSAAQRLRERGE